MDQQQQQQQRGNGTNTDISEPFNDTNSSSSSSSSSDFMVDVLVGGRGRASSRALPPSRRSISPRSCSPAAAWVTCSRRVH